MKKQVNQMGSAIRLILTLRCEHSSRLVSESLDRDLSWAERWAVRLHYIGCWSCRRFGKQMKLLNEAFKSRRDQFGDGDGLSPEAMQRIEEAIRKEY